jgi:hypothetical protein
MDKNNTSTPRKALYIYNAYRNYVPVQSNMKSHDDFGVNQNQGSSSIDGVGYKTNKMQYNTAPDKNFICHSVFMLTVFRIYSVETRFI